MTDPKTETVADRTGELLATAIATAENHLRAEVITLADPRDGTEALFAIGAHGQVNALPEAAFDGYRATPLYRKGTAVLTQLPSFIALVNRFKFAHSAIFAVDDFTKPSLTAIFDYHPDNAEVGGEERMQSGAPPPRQLRLPAVEGMAGLVRQGRQTDEHGRVRAVPRNPDR
jgi:hypothetical protein